MVSETPGSPIHQIRLFSKKSAFPLKKFSSRRKALFYLYFFSYSFCSTSLCLPSATVPETSTGSSLILQNSKFPACISSDQCRGKLSRAFDPLPLQSHCPDSYHRTTDRSLSLPLPLTAHRPDDSECTRRYTGYCPRYSKNMQMPPPGYPTHRRASDSFLRQNDMAHLARCCLHRILIQIIGQYMQVCKVDNR